MARAPPQGRVGHTHVSHRRDFIGFLVRELRTEPQARRKLVRINTAIFTVHSHPPASLPPGRKLTRFAGRAFGQGKNVVAKPALDLKRRAADWIAVALIVDRPVTRPNDDVNRTSRAAWRMPIGAIRRERT